MLNIKKFTLVILFATFLACTASKESLLDQKIPLKVQQGFQLTHTLNFPIDTSYTKAVVKVVNGNNIIGNGVFISNHGLLLTTYDPVLSMVSQIPKHNHVLNGFSATAREHELSLPNISVLILIDEMDVTEEYSSQIPIQSSNYQINQIEQEVTRTLIETTQSKYPNFLVQISEIYGGNRKILSVYKSLNDVRLVWNDDLKIDVHDLSNSDSLYHAISTSTAILRVYGDDQSTQHTSNYTNAPYQNEAHFKVGNINTDSNIAVALGFPTSTYRNYPLRALNFYKNVTNRVILNTYQSFINIQDSISASNTSLLYAGLYSRYNIKAEIERFTDIQRSLRNDRMIKYKENIQVEFNEWLKSDSTIEANYREIFTFVDQAYDIAEQNGASFYTTTYALRLSQLDDLTNQVKNFLEQSPTIESEQDLLDFKSTTLNNINKIRASIDITTELRFMSNTLVALKSLPESQQLPSLDGISFDNTNLEPSTRALRFLQRQVDSSFLFDTTLKTEDLNPNVFYSDTLFSILDEILFVNDMNRNNHSIFLAYQQPALQVFNAAYLEFLGESTFTPDANGTLRYNLGFIDSAINKQDKYLLTNNDFSANAKGSAVLSLDGTLLGITSNSSEYIGGNYSFSEENAFLKSVSVPYLYRQWENDFINDDWFTEIKN